MTTRARTAGYTRSAAVEVRLVDAITRVLDAHRSERLGQIIINAMRAHEAWRNLPVFEIHDEELIDLLNEYALGPMWSRGPDAR